MPSGRMAYELKYFGATTGRWSGGGGLNMQNYNRKPAEGVDLRRRGASVVGAEHREHAQLLRAARPDHGEAPARAEPGVDQRSQQVPTGIVGDAGEDRRAVAADRHPVAGLQVGGDIAQDVQQLAVGAVAEERVGADADVALWDWAHGPVAAVRVSESLLEVLQATLLVAALSLGATLLTWQLVVRRSTFRPIFR